MRFEPRVRSRLAAYVASHPGVSGSAATNRFVDEALRTMDHPTVIFREGPSGRRAVLLGGPDVWEVVRAVRDARDAEPDLDGDEVLELVSHNSGVPLRLVRAALAYWAEFPDEVDAEIARAEEAERSLVEGLSRQRELLAR